MMFKRALSPYDLTRRGLDSSILQRKEFQRGLLSGETANPIMRALASQLLNSAELEQALKVTQLSDNQHFSWLPGMVNKPPQGFFGAWTDALNLGGREFRDRDNLTTLAASRLKDKQDRLTRELMRSEEHTSELQSLMRISYAVFCLKKKKSKQNVYE